MKSKNKGNTFERKISNIFSETFKTYLKEDNGFRRNPDSGSYFGGSNSKKIQSHNLDYAVFGDIICPKNFKFSIECKHHKIPPSLQSIINQKIPSWDGWIQQAELDAKNANKMVLIIIKYNNVDELVLIQHPLFFKKSIFVYKEYQVYKLIDVLENDATYFFS